VIGDAVVRGRQVVVDVADLEVGLVQPRVDMVDSGGRRVGLGDGLERAAIDERLTMR